MSIIFRTQRKDLIGATIIDVDGKDTEGDLFDLRSITIECKDKQRRTITPAVDYDMFDECYLEVSNTYQ